MLQSDIYYPITIYRHYTYSTDQSKTTVGEYSYRFDGLLIINRYQWTVSVLYAFNM